MEMVIGSVGEFDVNIPGDFRRVRLEALDRFARGEACD
jgi:hypothetical protein